MANITNYLNKIKTAVYGRDVRGAIHDAIKECYDDASVNHDNANMEVKMARGTHNTLNDRLDKSDEIQAQTNAQLSIIEDKKLNVSDFVFLTPTMITEDDDNVKIQKLIDLGIEKGKVIFPRNGVYTLNRTIKIPPGIDVDFNNCQFNFTDGDYINNFCILVNTEDGLNWNGRSRMDFVTFTNLEAINRSSQQLKVVSFGCGSHVKSLSTRGFYQSITWTRNYIDYAHVEDVRITDHKGSLFAVSKTGNGDMVLIDGVHISNENENYNSVNISASQGCRILNTVNGNIYLFRCSGAIISNSHLEHGFILIEDSTCTIDNNFIWKRGRQEAVVLKDSGGSASDFKGRTVVLSNNTFVLKYEHDDYCDDTNDIKLNNYFNSCVLINNKRQVEAIGDEYKYSYTCGISYINQDGVVTLVDKAISRIVRQSLITDGITNNFLSGTSFGANIFNNVTASVINVPYRSDDVGIEYTYCLGLYYQSDRDIAVIDNNVVKTVTTTADKSVRIFLNKSFIGLDGCIRIYKGLSKGNYTKYVDVPIPFSSSLVDNGYSVNGYKWKEIENSDVFIHNKCYGFYQIGQNYHVYSAGTPTCGEWKVGDRIINSNPGEGRSQGWVCVESGTPGTWRSLGKI